MTYTHAHAGSAKILPTSLRTSRQRPGKKTHQHGRRPLGREPRGVPPVVDLAALPQRAAKVADGEEELLGGPLAPRGEGAVVADEGLELAAEGVALDPV